MTTDGWMHDAACRAAVAAGGAEHDWWFPSFPAAPGKLARAKAICESCPVQDVCRAHAIAAGEVGIWGGVAFGHRDVRQIERTCSECGTVFEAPPVSGRPRETCSSLCAKARHRRQQTAHAARRGGAVGVLKAAGHGRISTYNNGCRCRACRRAAREHRARYRAPRQASVAARRPTVEGGWSGPRNAPRNDLEGVA